MLHCGIVGLHKRPMELGLSERKGEVWEAAGGSLEPKKDRGSVGPGVLVMG